MILGITGSFGGGKSFVTSCFVERGWRHFDADAFCRAVYDQPSAEFLAKLRGVFGDGVFDVSGVPNRAAIAAIVFNNPTELAKLTALLYPALNQALAKQIAEWRADGQNAVAEIPLLFENGMEKMFDAVLTVWACREVRLERLTSKRGFTAAEFERRESLQMDADKKLELADYAIINNGSEDLVKQQVALLIEQFESEK